METTTWKVDMGSMLLLQSGIRSSAGSGHPQEDRLAAEMPPAIASPVLFFESLVWMPYGGAWSSHAPAVLARRYKKERLRKPPMG